MQRNQSISHGATAASQAMRSGDAHGGGHSVDLSEGE
jgi:type IV secretion system protein TrbL